jgi:Domain of unknown function (DUF4105)
VSLPIALLTLVVAYTPAPWADGRSQPEDLSISMVTFSPGDSLTEWWGHTALVVEDTKVGQARLYNYGMFGFSSGFLRNFLRGRLEFWVQDDPVLATFEWYKSPLNRDVRIQWLDLTPSEAAKVAKALADNVRPENRNYLYHHYNDNCSTRPRDIVDLALGGQIARAEAVPARMSLRDHTRRYSAVNVPVSLALDFLQNDELDRPITAREEAFLPDELEQQLDALQVTHDDGREGPLVKRKSLWFQSNRTPPAHAPVSMTWWLLLVGVTLAALALGLGWWGRQSRQGAGFRLAFASLHIVWGAVIGSLGLGLFLMGLLTDQSVTHRNENLFLGNPVTFALLPLGILLAFNASVAWRWLPKICVGMEVLGFLGVLLKPFSPFNQDNWNVMALLLPLTLVLPLAWRIAQSKVSNS